MLAGGSIASPDDEVPRAGASPSVALRELNEELVDDERVDLAMVGIADGMTIARKR